MAQNVSLQMSWPWNAKVIGKNKLVPSDSLTLKTDLDIKIIILSALVQKLWLKTSFYKMVVNIMHSHMSHIQTTQMFYCF